MNGKGNGTRATTAPIFNGTHDADQRLQDEATEILEMAREIERRTMDTSAWYAGMRAKVEERVSLEKVE